MSSKLIARNSFDRRYFWLKRLIAIFALVNLALVLFDLSYLTLRSLYLQATPALVQLYDPVKGVRPHPETQAYLNRVALLESQVVQVGVDSVQIEPLLSELRDRSRNLSQHHPFAEEDGDNTIQTIEQQLRKRTGTEAAFDRFWSQSYLTPSNWQSERAFWHDRIRPLMAANYYREVNHFGFAVDYFWSIDLLFILVLTIDILLRVRAIHQCHPELSWLESAVRRWYDLFLLVPVWRWLRVIPVLSGFTRSI